MTEYIVRYVLHYREKHAHSLQPFEVVISSHTIRSSTSMWYSTTRSTYYKILSRCFLKICSQRILFFWVIKYEFQLSPLHLKSSKRAYKIHTKRNITHLLSHKYFKFFFNFLIKFAFPFFFTSEN